MTQSVYKFKGIENLYSDLDGNFFFNEKRTTKIYNNGSISIKCGNSKRGLIKLRTLAYKSEIEISDCPF